MIGHRHIGALFITRWRIFFAVVIGSGVIWFWTCLPSPLFEDPYSTVILDRNSGLLGATIADDEQWRFPPGATVPNRFARALTTFEDQRFYQHPGVDPVALARAIWQNVSSRRIVSGASTLTMQTIRLSRRGQPRTIGEKLLEMAMALRLELAVGKEQILSLYCSHAPFGGNVVGLEAASWRYFGRRPEQLSWAEAAMLAVLPNSPALIHPGRNREALLNKRDRLLNRLWQRGIIDSLSCVLARLEPLPLKPHPLPSAAPHLLARYKAESRRWIATGSSATVASRLKTTLDGTIQRRASHVVTQRLERLAANGVHNIAAIILDVPSGTVLAYVGNVWDSVSNDHHHHVDVVTSPRSTGSILKPLLYGGMIQAGELLPNELVADVPIRIAGFAPENYSRTYQGAVPASMALARSLNIPAVRMLHSYGTGRFYSLLTRLGMSTLHRKANDYGLSLILGGAESTLWDITGIYAGMARSVNNHFRSENSGARVFFPPRYDTLSGIASDKRPNNILPVSSMTNDAPLDAAACWLTLKAMLEVTRPNEESSWREFTSSRKVAWKTATSQGFRDAWAIGVTPSHAIGVWVGNADGEGRPGLTGLSAAAPILFDLFGLLPASDWFECPESRLVQIDVCAKSGCRVGPFCATTVSTLVTPSGLRNSSCPYCRFVHCDSTLAWQVSAECVRQADIRSTPWFVLPPAMEWYYRESHTDYRPVPPFRPDCIESGSDNRSGPMAVIYPGRKGRIYVPSELDGARGRTVFEAAHRNPRTEIYWHLDGDYLGSTVDIHQMSLAPKPGEHRLVLVDEDGERSERIFTVLMKD